MTVAAAARRSVSPIDALLRAVTLKAAAHLSVGQLTIELPEGRALDFGSGEPAARLRILDNRFFRRLLLDGEIGFGEAYMDGLWSSDDIVGLLRLALRNRAGFGKGTKWLGRLSYWRNRRWHRSRRNTQRMSPRNIRDHYDLGNDFFRLWLDDTLTYSCAVFERPGQSLAEAQRNKYRLLAERTGVQPGMRVLEIGSGWGGNAIFLAQMGCQVTTITISQEQHDLARARIAQAGLADRIDVQLCDYRDVTGQFDRIVSIEMFEAVGAEYFATFFQKCAKVLKPGGLLGMQVITMPDRSFETQRRGVNWLQKHIFPGGVLPSIAAMESALATTPLYLAQVQDIGQHYPPTLRQWRQRFMAQLPAVRAQGFDDRFVRKWEFYLASCEAAFLEHVISDVHIILEKPPK